MWPAASVGRSLSFPGLPSPRQWLSGVWAHTPGTSIQTTAAESMGTQASQQTFAMRRDGLLDAVRSMDGYREDQGSSSNPGWQKIWKEVYVARSPKEQLSQRLDHEHFGMYVYRKEVKWPQTRDP